MEREFESELAGRVTGQETSRPSRKKGLLLGAVAVCAMLSVSALYSVAMPGESGPPITEQVIFKSEKAYLEEPVIDDVTGEVVGTDLLANRTMNLKVKGDHLYAEVDCPLHYAKFVYVLNVEIVDSDARDDWEGMTLGQLTLPTVPGIDEVMTLTPEAKVTRSTSEGDISITIDPEDDYAFSEGYIVTVKIPTLSGDDAAYDDGDSIAISVVVWTEADIADLEDLDSIIDLEDELVTEIAWDDQLTEVEGEIDTVPDLAP